MMGFKLKLIPFVNGESYNPAEILANALDNLLSAEK